MGYHVEQMGGDFVIEAKDMEAAHQALVEWVHQDRLNAMKWVHDSERPTVRRRIKRWHTTHVNAKSPSDRARSLEAMLAEYNWNALMGREGGVFDLFIRVNKSLNQENVLPVLAPYVKQGSWLQFYGAEGEIWRWVFSEGKHVQEFAEIKWVEAEMIPVTALQPFLQ